MVAEVDMAVAAASSLAAVAVGSPAAVAVGSPAAVAVVVDAAAAAVDTVAAATGNGEAASLLSAPLAHPGQRGRSVRQGSKLLRADGCPTLAAFFAAKVG
jgi:hypothetical protein